MCHKIDDWELAIVHVGQDFPMHVCNKIDSYLALNKLRCMMKTFPSIVDR